MEKSEPKVCPKCSANMDEEGSPFALPGYIDNPERKDTSVGVSMIMPLAVTVHRCPDCMYVELWG